MGAIENKLTQMGLSLPAPSRGPDGVKLPFSFINLRRGRAFISGHPAQDEHGAIIGPYGQLGVELTTDEGYAASRQIALSVLANLKAEIGDLERITGWGRVFGMVNSAPGFCDQHLVINGFSDLIIEAFGADIGRHARSAIGVAGLPMNFAIEIEAEVLLDQ